MKIACLYILSLCFLLLGGYCAAYGIVPNDGNHAAVKHIGKTQLIKIPNTNRLPVIAGNALPLESKETIVSIESKDDEIQALFNFVATVEEVRNMHINSTQHI